MKIHHSGRKSCREDWGPTYAFRRDSRRSRPEKGNLSERIAVFMSAIRLPKTSTADIRKDLPSQQHLQVDDLTNTHQPDGPKKFACPNFGSFWTSAVQPSRAKFWMPGSINDPDTQAVLLKELDIFSWIRLDLRQV